MAIWNGLSAGAPALSYVRTMISTLGSGQAGSELVVVSDATSPGTPSSVTCAFFGLEVRASKQYTPVAVFLMFVSTTPWLRLASVVPFAATRAKANDGALPAGLPARASAMI